MKISMKQKLTKILAGIIFTLGSFGCSIPKTNNLETTLNKDNYSIPTIITKEQHIESLKKALRKQNEYFPYHYFLEPKDIDYDGDGIEDIYMKTKKGSIWYISSKEISEGKTNNNNWIWHKYENKQSN